MTQNNSNNQDLDKAIEEFFEWSKKAFPSAPEVAFEGFKRLLTEVATEPFEILKEARSGNVSANHVHEELVFMQAFGDYVVWAEKELKEEIPGEIISKLLMLLRKQANPLQALGNARLKNLKPGIFIHSLETKEKAAESNKQHGQKPVSRPGSSAKTQQSKDETKTPKKMSLKDRLTARLGRKAKETPSSPRNQVSNPDGTANQKKSSQGMMDRIEGMSWTTVLIIAGVIVFLALAGFAIWYFQPGLPSFSAPNFADATNELTQEEMLVKPEMPTPTPLDINSSNWLNPIIQTVLLILFLTQLSVLIDALMRKQPMDAILALVLGIIVLTAWDSEVIRFFSTRYDVGSGGLVLFALGIVIYAAYSGGFDVSNCGLFLMILGGGAIMRGNFGALSVSLKIAPGPIYPLTQAWQFYLLKEYPQAEMSLYCFGIQLLAVLMFVWESIKPRERQRGFRKNLEAVNFLSLFVAALGFLAYYVSAYKYNIPNLGSVIIAAMVVLLAANLIPLSIKSKYVQASADNWGQIQFGSYNFKTPFDVMALYLAMALLTILITGHI
jgi:hypothetical protein